jgi:hypothetical protein
MIDSRIEVNVAGGLDISLPKMANVRQKFEATRLHDVSTAIAGEFRRPEVRGRVTPGQVVAVGCGSRGVANIAEIARCVVRELQALGARPFVFPAMGSHGAATAEGQKKVLESYGISEAATGVPVKASMDTVVVGHLSDGTPVQVDKHAAEADGIVVINRIKPHVAFRGPYESGLMKMLAIGLGKQYGAEICHNLGFGRMAASVPAIGKVVLASGKILMAIALLENPYHETCRIEVLAPEEVAEAEPPLQLESRVLLPRFYCDNFDVLVIDEIGKNISGTGFDNNVVGRYHTQFISGGPTITRVAALDITDESHGNANGLGILDFTTRRAFDKFDFEQTYPNSLTSTVPTSVKIPMVLGNDRQAIQAAIKTCNIARWEDVRFTRIRNTLAMSEIEVSENIAAELAGNPNVSVVSEPCDLAFDADGNLLAREAVAAH